MSEQITSSRPATRLGFWSGVAAGVGALVLIILIVMGIGFVLMGRCPMCGRMMEMSGNNSGGGMMDGGMMGGDGEGATQPHQGMMEEMPQWMMSTRPMAGMMQDMAVIHQLLQNHEKIDRQVEDIPRGIQSTTTSDDAEVAKLIRQHVHQMKQRVEEGRPIRMMDPVFREIFRHHDKIHMEIEEIPGGVRVVETSEDPQVVLLIRQHAYRAVSEFVEGGMQRAMQPTRLPAGYEVDQEKQ